MIGKEQVVTKRLPYRMFRMDVAKEKAEKILARIFFRWGVFVILIGFLLGRSVIIGELTPFAVPFIAVLYHLRRDKLLLAGAAVIAGAVSHQFGAPLSLALGMVFFIFVQKLLERWDKGGLRYAPFAVFLAVFLSNLLLAFNTSWSGYALTMAGIEASLSLVLTLIFIQVMPLVTTKKRRKTLKNEELVCLAILLASMLTGTVGWMMLGLSLEHVLSRYAILVFALAAGGAIGATVGVVLCIVLSLANVGALLEMSLLAFCGLLGGLLREGKKIGVAAGLLVGTVLMGLYVGETQLLATMNESLVAILLFLLTPKSVFSKLSQFIPGTVEHASAQQDYMRRLRDVTSQKVNQFSKLFFHLSKSFEEREKAADEDCSRQVDLFLSEVTEKTCQVCHKKERCWSMKYDDTYRLMNDLFDSLEVYGNVNKPGLLKDLEQHCVKSEKVISCMEKEMEQFKTYLSYKTKLTESRRLVADQLSGISKVMTDFAREIKREGQTHHLQEQQVVDALEDIGLSVHAVDIVSLEEGNVQVDIHQPKAFGYDECVKIVAPLLSDIIGEQITVAEQAAHRTNSEYCIIKLVSAKRFCIQSGVASAAKGGGILSGDSSNMMDIGNGKYALAIADGMGNGERAHLESKETLKLLQHILRSGIEETVAIKSINSVLSLRSTEEVFSTLDLAMVDLQTAETKFLKIGSTPSFIKRGQKCTGISAHNLPIGILDSIEVDVVNEQLKAGDILVMMTDGIYDAPRYVENKEMWMKRLIAEIETDHPQEVADLLLEKVIRYHQGHILDDMTVVVAKIERNIPQWSTISTTGIPKLNQTGRPSALSV